MDWLAGTVWRGEFTKGSQADRHTRRWPKMVGAAKTRALEGRGMEKEWSKDFLSKKDR